MTNAKASAAAKALLEEFWDLKLPIDPKFFAEKLGIEIVSANLGLRSGFLDADKKQIHINEIEPIERQRFTIAHELGHFCLGHGSSNRNTALPGWYGEYDPVKETQANQFAADLLMPAIAMKAVIDVRGIRDAVTLRQVFGVSSQAMNVRLKSLGYIQ